MRDGFKNGYCEFYFRYLCYVSSAKSVFFSVNIQIKHEKANYNVINMNDKEDD